MKATSNGVPARRTDHADDWVVRDWHRRAFTNDYPCLDLDCVLLEYDRSTPVAIMDFKYKDARPLDRRSANCRALENLANAASVPCFEVRWRRDLAVFKVAPIGYYASYWLRSTIEMQAAGYIEFVKDLRHGAQGADVFRIDSMGGG